MPKTLEKGIDELTQCPICASAYVSPRSLPCVHTFCTACLETYIADKRPGDKATCPMCRQEFVIPGGGVAKLPVNIYIGRLLDMRKPPPGSGADETRQLCDVCADDDEPDPDKVAAWRCVDCDQTLCESCCRVHQRLRPTASHVVVESKAYDSHDVDQEQQFEGKIFIDIRRAGQLQLIQTVYRFYFNICNWRISLQPER